MSTSYRFCKRCSTKICEDRFSSWCSDCDQALDNIVFLKPPPPPPPSSSSFEMRDDKWDPFTMFKPSRYNLYDVHTTPWHAASVHDPDPAMLLQSRTPGTDSVLSPLGSDSGSNSDLDLLRKRTLWMPTENKIRQREPIRQVKIRVSDLPSLDLPSSLPSLYRRRRGRTSLQQQPPPSTSTRIRRPAAAPYLSQSQSPTPTTTPYANWPAYSFTSPDSSPLGSLTLQSSPYSIPTPSTRLHPYLTPHYLPEYLPERSLRTATHVGGTPSSILEDPEKLEKALRGVSRPAYLMLSISAALLNINAFNTNSITKVPLMIATTTSFFAVIIHWMATLQLHVSQSMHHIKRPLVLLVAFLGVSVFATVFALPAHSWSQEECNPYCWVERALVSTVVIGGFASLMIGGWRMRGSDGRLATGMDWSS